MKQTQTLSQFYHLQLHVDAVETFESIPLKLTDYHEQKTAAETVLIHRNSGLFKGHQFLFFKQTMHLIKKCIISVFYEKCITVRCKCQHTLLLYKENKS